MSRASEGDVVQPALANSKGLRFATSKSGSTHILLLPGSARAHASSRSETDAPSATTPLDSLASGVRQSWYCHRVPSVNLMVLAARAVLQCLEFADASPDFAARYFVCGRDRTRGTFTKCPATMLPKTSPSGKGIAFTCPATSEIGLLIEQNTSTSSTLSNADRVSRQHLRTIHWRSSIPYQLR